MDAKILAHSNLISRPGRWSVSGGHIVELMKLLFDLFPVILFFAAFKLSGDNIFVATWVAIIASLLQVGLFWLKNRRMEKMHIVSLGLLVVFGGMTLYFQNELFIKWKPTIFYWIFALAFITTQYVGKKNLVQRMLGNGIEAPPHVWRRLNIGWIIFFIVLGAINLLVAYNFDNDTWVKFKLFGALGATFVFALFQAYYLVRFMSTDPNDNKENIP